MSAVGPKSEGSPAADLQARMFDAAGVRESRGVVLALMKTAEIEIAVEWLKAAYRDDATFAVEDSGVYYRIDCQESFTFDLDEIQLLVGRPYNVYDFLVNVSTTIGRAYVAGNTFTITTALIGWEAELPR